MKRKSPFLLLEILIAIFLVSLCLIPLIQTPIRSYRNELRLLEEMERERLADWTFTEIKEKLLKNELAWANFPRPELTTGPFHLPNATLEIPGMPPRSVERRFSLHCGKKGEKTGLQGEVYRLLKVVVTFDGQTKQKEYSYRLVVRKLPLTSKFSN